MMDKELEIPLYSHQGSFDGLTVGETGEGRGL